MATLLEHQRAHELKAEFRAAKSMLVPYVSIDLSGLTRPIQSIRVGPSPPHSEANRAAVDQLLVDTSRKWPDLVTNVGLVVRDSAVPYRDW